MTQFIYSLTSVICLSVVLSGNIEATIIDVPVDYGFIQVAINASNDGDTILVEPGTYFENINFRGHLVVLTSRYYLAKDTSYICSTIIDGSQPAYPDTASCIILNSSEDSTTVIQGFTITGGAGTRWLDIHGAGTYREGGGILTEFSSPVIRNNHIIYNTVMNTSGVVSTGGGGLRCGDGHPYIYDNVIAYNQGRYGGGIVYNYCNGAFLKNNIIAHNSGGQSFGGGGVWATGTGSGTTVTLENNTIACNHVSGSGAYGGKGGGIFVFSVTLQTKNNIVWGNTQVSGNSITGFSGGTIQTDYSDIDFAASGNGNISQDPLFTDTVLFMLSTGSPCIDAGDTLVSNHDITVSPNIAAYPSQGTEHNDMGAYGGPLAAVDPECSLLSASVPENNALNDVILSQDHTARLINLYSPAEKILKIEMLGLEGENIFATQTNTNLTAVPVGQITSGIYVIRISLKNKSVVKKILID